MSLLTATSDDLKGGRGQPLPDRVWTATVQSAQVVQKDNGSRIEAVLTAFRDRDGTPEITLPNGATYRPGNRKVFDRQWIDHTNPKAAEIGQRYIKKQAMSAGLMPKPTNWQTVALDFANFTDYAAALVGRDVTVRTKQRQRQTADGTVALDPETQEPIIDVEVGDYLVD